MKQKKQIQPTPKKGFEFTGWATFNWGISHNRVFRTRKEAIEWLMEMQTDPNETWKKTSTYVKVVKVKCTVL